MTLETVFRNVLKSSNAPRYDHLPFNQAPRYPGGKNGETGELHLSGYKKLKGKSKLDKKQAILSALMLLAFLFFLHVLQSCIREQNQNRVTIAMFGATGATAPTAPAASNVHHSKAHDREKRSKPDSKESRRKRNILDQQSENTNRKNSRSLLGLAYSEVGEAGKANAGGVHRLKFIRDFEKAKNWTIELSQMTDQDLKNQKTKTFDHLFLQEKPRRFVQEKKPPVSSSPAPTKETNHYAHPNVIPPKVKVVKKRENIFKDIDVSSNKSRISGELAVVTANHIDKKKEIWKNGLKSEAQKKVTPFFQNYFKYRNPEAKTFQRGSLKTSIQKQSLRRVLENNAANPKNVTVAQKATTPRSRFSDYPSTPKPSIREDYEEDGGQVQTIPVYKYSNHRPHDENQTSESEILKKQENSEKVHEEISKDSMEPPLFYPGLSSPPNYEKLKHRRKHSNRHGNFPTRHRHPSETRFGDFPYRGVSAHEAPQFHQDYLRPLVLARYPQEEESGFDLATLFWTTLESLAKPLTNLVPPFAKENNEEPHCYNLLVCEAQRFSKLIGPTAEAFTATVGSLLTWSSSEETRQAMADAISAGRSNTCQQQIKDCENRSGGKSALTVIAQVMELKVR